MNHQHCVPAMHIWVCFGNKSMEEKTLFWCCIHKRRTACLGPSWNRYVFIPFVVIHLGFDLAENGLCERIELKSHYRMLEMLLPWWRCRMIDRFSVCGRDMRLERIVIPKPRLKRVKTWTYMPIISIRKRLSEYIVIYLLKGNLKFQFNNLWDGNV